MTPDQLNNKVDNMLRMNNGRKLDLLFKILVVFVFCGNSISLLHSQDILLDIDFTSLATGATAGSGWSAGGANNCDGNSGTWEVINGQGFVAQDIEGRSCCPCAPGAADNFCGNNDSRINFNVNTSGYCKVDIIVSVSGSSGLHCNDNSPFACYNGTDQVNLVLGGSAVVPILCGNLQIGTGLSDFPVGGSLSFQVAMGTQQRQERYTLTSVRVIGYKTPEVENLTISSRAVCEGDEVTLCFDLIGECDSKCDLDWIGPNGINIPITSIDDNSQNCVSFIATSNHSGGYTIFGNYDLASCVIAPSEGVGLAVIDATNFDNVDAIDTVCQSTTPLELQKTYNNVEGTWTSDEVGITMDSLVDVSVPGVYPMVWSGIALDCDLSIPDTLVVLPSEPISLDAIGPFCDEDASIMLDPMPGGHAGMWTGPGVMGTEFDPQIAGTGTHTLIFIPDDASICLMNATVDIEITSMQNAGPDVDLDSCLVAGEPLIINFEELIDDLYVGDIESAEQPTDPMVILTDITQVDFGGQMEGTYTFWNIKPQNGNCEADTALITINLELSPKAGENHALDLCLNATNSVVDFVSLVGIDSIGDIQDVGGSGVNLTDLTQVDFIGLMVGDTYSFRNVVGINGSCGTDTSWIDISLIESHYAGRDTSLTICEGASSLVIDFTGLFMDPMLIATIVEDGGSNSNVSLSDLFNVDFENVGIGTYTFYNITAANGSCPPDSAQITIDIISSPDAGEDGILVICEGDNTLYDLFDYLEGNPQSGGTWLDDEGSGVVPTEGILTDFSSINVTDSRVFDFSYVIDDGSCMDRAVLTLSVINRRNAGSDNSITFCEGSGAMTDIELLIGAHDDGSWETNPSNPEMVNISNPNNIDFSGLANGTYEFWHIVQPENASVCPIDTAFVRVNVDDNVSAGDNFVAPNICDGSVVSFDDLINGDMGGRYVSVHSDVTIVNDSIYTVGLMAGVDYEIWYILDANGTCEADTVLITFQVVNESNAGNDNSTTICGDASLNLTTLIDGDAGGAFSSNDLPPSALSGSTLTTNGLMGSYTVFYVVGDGMTCPLDSARIDITVTPNPDISFTSMTDQLCEGDCIYLEVETFGGLPTDVAIEAADGAGFLDTLLLEGLNPTGGFEMCFYAGSQMGFSNDTLIVDISGAMTTWVMRALYADNGQCRVDYPTLVHVVGINLSQEIQRDITGPICDDEQIIINGVIYDRGNPIGTETKSGMNCDTIFNIDLVVNSSTIETIATSICENESLTINGVVYSSNNPTGTDTLTAVNGCDSIIIIDLDFNSSFRLEVEESICDGDSIFLAGHWQHSPGVYIDSLTTVTGCDSVIISDLAILNCSVTEFVQSFDVTCYGGDDGRVILTLSNGTPPYYVEFNNRDGEDSGAFEILSNDAPIPFNTLSAGIYDFTVYAVDENGAVLTNFTVTINEPPLFEVDINLLADLICFGENNASLEAVISGGFGNIDLLWSTNATSSQIDNIGSGMYTIVATDESGCTASDQLTIMEPLETDFSVEVTHALCDASPDGSIIVEVNNGNGPFIYSIDGVDFDTDNEFVGLDAGEYQVHVMDADMCIFSSSPITIEYDSGLEVILPDQLVVTVFDTTQITANFNFNPSRIEWTPNIDISCTDCTNPIITTQVERVYCVTAYDQNGCSVKDSILFLLEDFMEVYIPNVIDLDDNNNTVFKPYTINNIQGVSYDMYIFDRWGNSVYQVEGGDINNAESGWNGLISAAKSRASNGVYVYKILVTFQNGQQREFIGNLSIL